MRSDRWGKIQKNNFIKKIKRIAKKEIFLFAILFLCEKIKTLLEKWDASVKVEKYNKIKLNTEK